MSEGIFYFEMATFNSVWFHLVDSATGQTYKGTTADAVSLFYHSVIVQLRDAVKAKYDYQGFLKDIPAGTLLVYKNKAAFEMRNAALKEDDSLNGLGTSESDSLIVVVPSHNGLASLMPLTANESQPTNQVKRFRTDEDFVTNSGLNLYKECDLIAYMISLLDKVGKKCTNLKANFKDDCLEFRLDRRMTSYVLNTTDNIKLFLGPSGCGKTRMMLELLFQNFGYYFTVTSASCDFGSKDLSVCMQYCNQDPNLAKFYISTLYYVRSTVCNYLMKTLKMETPGEILVVQLHPVQFFGCDMFESLFVSVIQMSSSLRTPILSNLFSFVAIDEIQISLIGDKCHQLPESNQLRPFFSALVYYSKKIFSLPQFLMAGTGIDFDALTENFGSNAMRRDLVLNHELLAYPFHPLTKEQVESYARMFLSEHQFLHTEEIVQRICEFELCHGRARFIAFLLDSLLDGKDIEQCITEFVLHVTNIHSMIFPLARLKKDFSKGPTFGNDTLFTIFCNGLIDSILQGKAILNVSDQIAANVIQYGLGFAIVDNNSVSLVQLCEKAVCESLRYFIPFGSIVQNLASRISVVPKAQMVGYLIEYLVTFAFVANTLGSDRANNIKIYDRGIPSYLRSNDENIVCLPDHMCGADIIYKSLMKKIIYIIQIKFVKGMTKQQQVNACNTTDPQRFYCNRTSGHVLKGFEDKIGANGETKMGTRSFVLDELRNLQRDNYSIQRLVFVHTSGKQVEEMEGVEVISSSTQPHFFDAISSQMWKFLDSVRDKFEEQ